jgi:hypothetical protein
MNPSIGSDGPPLSVRSPGPTISTLAATVLAAAAILPMGCTSKTCTEIGCSSGANVMVVGAVDAWAPILPMNLTVCADDCRIFRVERDDGATICRPVTSESRFGSWECRFNDAGNAMLRVAVGSAGTVAITLSATDDANTELFHRSGSVEVTTFHPNGPDCAGSCFQGSTSLQP